MRVLVVEDDIISAKSIVAMLSTLSATIDQTDNGQEALELIARYDYDIVVLDLVLPDIEGFDVVRRVRGGRKETPILILSGLARPQAKTRGLSLGADDFLTKPFDQAEFLARVRAIIRRSKGYSSSRICVANASLDIERKRFYAGDVEVSLTIKEYQILELLILRKGMTISKELFLDHLYGGIDEPEIKIIDVFICKLRKKLAKFGVLNLIGTAWGRGYVVNDQQTSGPLRGNLDSGHDGEGAYFSELLKAVG